MMNEIIPGLSKNSKTWQCCQKSSYQHGNVFYCVFHTQLLAGAGFGPSENLKTVRKFSWNWLFTGRSICSSGTIKFFSFSVWKIVFVTQVGGQGWGHFFCLPRIPSGIHWEQPQSKTWAKNFICHEEEPETQTGAEFWHDPHEIWSLTVWNGFFYSLRPWHVAHPPEPPSPPPAGWGRASCEISFVNMYLCFWSTLDGFVFFPLST